jgi:peptidylprolyl isomerase
MKIGYMPLLAFLIIFLMPTISSAQQTAELDLENTIYLELETGRVVIKLLPEVAPNHVARIKKLSREKFYDGLKFHRVIEGFMAQTGDPRGTGEGIDYETLDAEFSDTPHYKGMVSMARTDDPNSAGTQFFICLAYSPHLDGLYSVWGEVVAGMRYVDKIKIGEYPTLTDPDIIVTMRVAADVEE